MMPDVRSYTTKAALHAKIRLECEIMTMGADNVVDLTNLRQEGRNTVPY